MTTVTAMGHWQNSACFKYVSWKQLKTNSLFAETWPSVAGKEKGVSPQRMLNYQEGKFFHRSRDEYDAGINEMIHVLNDNHQTLW